MLLSKNKSEEELLNSIKLSITHIEKPIGFRYPPSLKNQLYGNVGDHNFWLQKTTPHLSKLPQRYFKGFVENNGNKCIIRGRFLFPKAVTAIYLSMILVIIMIFVVRRILTGDWTDPINIFLMVCAVYLISAFGLGILRYRREEQYILHFLESL